MPEIIFHFLFAEDMNVKKVEIIFQELQKPVRKKIPLINYVCKDTGIKCFGGNTLVYKRKLILYLFLD